MSCLLDQLVVRLRATLELDRARVHAMGISGGADSSALCILMCLAFPDIRFRLVFSDTGAEIDEVYATLEKLEAYLGVEIERIDSGETLFTLIEKYGGYLPSAQARWCTRALKLAPFQRWMRQFAGETIKLYVGIRADEDRIGFTAEGVESEMPFVAAGVVREEVFRVLAETIGIPRFYQDRSRSGCQICPFFRQTESIALLQTSPDAFHEVAKLEKGASSGHGVLPVPAWEEAGLGKNWVGFPLPSNWLPGKEGMAPNQASLHPGDLFDGPRQGLWAAAEFFVEEAFASAMGSGPVVWRQQLVAVSTTRSGLIKQLSMHHQHRLTTAEVWFLDQQQMADELRYVVYYLQVREGLLDISRPAEGAYTWQQGTSLQRTEHLVRWAERALHAEQMRRRGEDPIDAGETRVAYLEVVEPPAPSVDEVLDERHVACPMCSL